MLLCSYALALSLFIGSGSAQTTNATLVGTVVDPQAGAIAGATVTVKDKGTAVSRTVQSESDGTFRVSH